LASFRMTQITMIAMRIPRSSFIGMAGCRAV
jgi:hypothetical protein